MKRLLLLGLAIVLAAPVKSVADGMFVAPKFVWDKHKDISEPTQKAIVVYDAGQEDLVLQVKYEGLLDQFGWLIPVPNLPTVQKGSMKCFYELSQYTQQHFITEAPHTRGATDGFGTPGDAGLQAPPPPVQVVEIKTVGAYEIAVLSTKDTSALTQWLQTNQFYFPTNKQDVIDSYVRQHWYFVAVKINLGHSLFLPLATENKLASGELNPLRISFASDRCVFPLKISSVSGHPSEIQVYVLSPEPLLEKSMLEQKMPMIYSNNLAEAVQRAQAYQNMLTMRQRMRVPNGSSPMPILSTEQSHIAEISQRPWPGPYDLLPYAKVTRADLPDSVKAIPRLANQSWWLTKQTWTFKPEEMRDLQFDPAIPYFAGELGSIYGYYAAASLGTFGQDAGPALMAALQSMNAAVRSKAARLLNPVYDSRNGPIRDPNLTAVSLALSKDPEPEVRTMAAAVLGDDWNPAHIAPLVEMLSDDDNEVRWMAENGLEHHPADVANEIPHFKALLRDKNPAVRGAAYQLVHRLDVPLSREDLLAVFEAPAMGPVWEAYRQFQEVTGRNVTDTEALPLLQNSEPNLRGGLALVILYQNADKQAVEMALPLLKDPEIPVRVRAAQTLRALTGRHFTYEQADEWENWWTESKTNFVVELHPEELKPPTIPPRLGWEWRISADASHGAVASRPG